MATESAVRIMESNRSGKWAPPAAYTSPVITEELGMLLRGQNNIHRDQVNTVAPNRSESAPPSMEGSFAAFDQFQADPSYSTFYPSSNIDLTNPRFPSGNDRRLASSGSLYGPRNSLSTHQEEPEDDKAESLPGQNTSAYFGRHKSLVDLVQEDFPKVTSQIYSQTHSSSNAEESVNQDFQSLSLGSMSLKISTSPERKLGVGSSDTIIKDPSIRTDQLFPQKNELTTLDKTKESQDLLPAYQLQGTVQGGANKTGSVEIPQQPFVHAQPPLYATAAAYMTPGNSLYPNYGASGLYSPPYSGYTLGSSYLPPYLTGYPPQTGFPSQFNGNPGQSLTGQSPTSESISRERFFGTMQPPFSDPLSMQYYQQLVQDSYSIPMQYSRFPSPLSPVDSFPLQNEYTSPSGSFGVPSPRTPASNYISTPTGLGFVHQSPLGSPVLPGSPIAGAGRRYEMGFSQSSPRNSGGYGRWQGQRGTDGLGDHRKHAFLEELKASGTQRIDLSDIVGRIVEFSVDQHGSRFIQQKLENCSAGEKELVFKEVLPHAPKLITDVFGNYVIQKFFEHGTPEQRKELASRLTGHMLPLSLQMYGCRVIQKALEVIEPDQKKELVLELDGNVMKCVRDQNGNHVIQKCIECLPADNIDFIISAFESHVATLSTHPYGCRVIQRILEHCSDEAHCRTIVDEILESAYDLAQDQYGNYVIQHVLGRGKPYERSKIMSQLSGKIVQLSQHKYASNVIEKCLEFGDANEREILIEEILAQSEENDCLLAMMKDQFANYVVQKILEISNSRHREMLLNRIQVHIDCLKKFTYGKHIVARYEQLSGEEGSGTSDS